MDQAEPCTVTETVAGSSPSPLCSTCRCIRGRAHKHDSGWAWVVAVCGCLCNVLALGCTYSFGVIYPSLLDEFKKGKAKTAWIGSLSMSLSFFFGPLVGKLCDRFGPRMVTIFGGLVAVIGLVTTSQVQSFYLLYLTYSGIFTFGSCCVYTSVFLIVPRYFLRWSSLVTGMIASGPGAGIFVMSPILGSSVEGLGWRGAFLVMAALVSTICVLGCTFDPNIPRNTPEKRNCKLHKNNKRPTKLWRNSDYLLMVFVTIIALLGVVTPQVHMARYCEDKGINLDLASKIYLAFGLCSAFARIVVGRLCDVAWVNRRYAYGVGLLALGISTLLCPLANSFLGLLLYFIAFGLFEGGQATLANILILTAVSEEQQARAFGIWLFTMSLSIAAGPPLAGYIVDSTGSYPLAFYIAGGILVFSASVHFIVNAFKSSHNENTNEEHAELCVVEKVTVL